MKSFNFRSSGSHVVYHFDFGDGTVKIVHGIELSHMNLDMTMFAEVTHSYSKGRQCGFYLIMSSLLVFSTEPKAKTDKKAHVKNVNILHILH